MDIATSYTTQIPTVLAVEEAIFQLNQKIAHPKVILAYFTVTHDANLLRELLEKAYPNAQILGCSSCQGVMTEAGYHGDHTIALWGLCDYYGAYGSALASFADEKSTEEMVKETLFDAIEQAQRIGELPRFILFHATPGLEEQLIEGIERILGSSVPIIGGSAADDTVQGEWEIFNQTKNSTNGLALMVFYPSCQIRYSFHSGYASTGRSAIVTKADGRHLLELNHQPAAQVYKEWHQQPWQNPTSILAETSLNPLGRTVGHIHEHPYFKLSHPQCVTAEKGLMLFTEVQEGETLHYMEGTLERLVTRAGRVINQAHESGRSVEPIGGIMIYCAGCMLQVKTQIHDVSLYMNKAMHHGAFVCPFTFGEQGQFIGGENAHGNLMISAVLFHRENGT